MEMLPSELAPEDEAEVALEQCVTDQRNSPQGTTQKSVTGYSAWDVERELLPTIPGMFVIPNIVSTLWLSPCSGSAKLVNDTFRDLMKGTF